MTEPATFTTYEALVATMRQRRANRTRRELPSAEYLRELFDYSPDTGEIRWRERVGVPASWNTKYAGTLAGNWGAGYLRIGVDSVIYVAHRLIWKMAHDTEPLEVDHVNGDSSDNRLCNLRPCDESQNQANKGRYRNNKVGLKGVTLHACGKYQATIKHNKKHIYLGLFSTAEEAHAAYCRAAIERHGEFARFE